MAKPVRSKDKRKKVGNSSKYTTRNKALTDLQLKLPEFRRLCILKGIHPREPKKKFAGNSKTYYHVKDVKFLAHEPLLQHGREIKAYDKKTKKARAKKCEERSQRFTRLRPTYSLDHLVKERYPSFIDALRDMDDALTMLNLFATLPADNGLTIPMERVYSARRLSLEFQAYVIRTHSLRKIFVSVKGIYYQAVVTGQNITWLSPHSLSQVLPVDVDYRVMLTFVEFHETLIGFVNFKLYDSLGLRYPPALDRHVGQAAIGLDELVGVVDLDGDREGEEDDETKKSQNLFKDLRFFLAREVPQDSLLFVISSFGGTVSLEGDRALFEESDESITHQICDRATLGHVFLTRMYLQPQWVYDSANAGVLLPMEGYLLGSIPPPHLSPFVDNEAEGYIPEYGNTIKHLQAAAANSVLPITMTEFEDMHDASDGGNVSVTQQSISLVAAVRDSEDGAVENAYSVELSKEIAGVPFSASTDAQEPNDSTSQEALLQTSMSEISDRDMTAMMMTKKVTQLYKAIEMGKVKKKASVELLKHRKRNLKKV